MKYKVVALFFTLCSVAVLAQKTEIDLSKYKAAAIPDSLKQNANSVIRYLNKEIYVKSPGKAVLKEHLIQTILNEKDEREALFLIHYDQKFSDVNSAEMRVFDANGTLIRKYKKSDFYDRSAIDGISIITDSRIKVVGHSIASYPLTVEKIHEITVNNFLDLSDWHILDEEVSLEYAKCKVITKPNIGFRYQLKHFRQLPVTTKEDENEVVTWEVKALKAIKPEIGAESWSYLPRISFATNSIDCDNIPGDMSSWRGFGKWIQELNGKASDLSAARVEEIRKMVAGLASDKEKAKFLYEYMQKNMRYVSIQLGIGGLKPFPASFVDQKKYGDCKALSNYMHSLLKAVDIQSYYALVRARSNEEPADPKFVNDPFNHIILCVPFGRDTTWLECTSNTQLFGKLGSFTENRNALLITEDGGKLVNTPTSKSADYLFDSDVKVDIQGDGSATAKIKLKSTGEYRSMFIALSELKTDDQKKHIIEYLNLKQPDFIELKYESDKDGIKELAIDLAYAKLSDVATGNKVFYKPRLIDLWKNALPPLENRKTDFYFDHPMLKKSTTVLTIPAEFEVESLPPNINYTFSNGHYAVNYSYNKEENNVVANASLEITNHVIPAKKYTELQKFVEDISKSMSKKMVIRRKI